MVYTLRFFPSKCSLFHNSNVFGSCIIHILYKGVLKLKKIIPAPKGQLIARLYVMLRVGLILELSFMSNIFQHMDSVRNNFGLMYHLLSKTYEESCSKKRQCTTELAETA